jgi:hypothetical protein
VHAGVECVDDPTGDAAAAGGEFMAEEWRVGEAVSPAAQLARLWSSVFVGC